MTGWTALIPLKPPGARKTRLAERLSEAARGDLSRHLFDHVVGILATEPRIATLLPISHEAPEGWTATWRPDEGRGLNAELMTARTALGTGPLLVIHADLPLVNGADIAALLDAAEAEGAAIAPDRHGAGTNALALHDASAFTFCFGADSLARHRAQRTLAIVARPGLALDIDTPADLDTAIASGFRYPRA